MNNSCGFQIMDEICMVNQVSIFDEINTFILFLINLILLLSDVKNGLGLIQLILPHIHTYIHEWMN